jgi:predicted AlkP superfamily phosphohydrolase/phosphomutase
LIGETKIIDKVIVIGLDGLEPTIVESLLALGELPNLARLRERGGYARVATTTPAQTPVAWSTFATGTNPGGHGIFDFLRRDPQTYRPDIALNRYVRKNAFLPPKAENLRQGTPVWRILADAGVPSTIVRCPCTYPPEPMRGRLLSGMGVPDLRGGFGTGTYYTTDASTVAGEGESIVRIEADSNGAISSHLIGPRNPKTGEDVRLGFTLRPDRVGRRLELRLEGSSAAVELKEGRWSDWLRVAFKVGLLQSIRGIVRFYVARVGPETALYASPINFDPTSPLFPISAPATYADELAESLGLFHTTGMVEDHAGLNNDRFDEWAFLDQCETAWREREAMLRFELERFERGLLYCLFDTPDRVQHMFWRFREPDHPSNHGRPVPHELSRVIEGQYRRGDSIVGEVLARADDRTLVIVLSDHGFNTFRRGLNLNTWLYDHGLLALKDGKEPGEEAGDLLRGIDWSRTKAYSVGLSGVYLNLQGREGHGIVRPADVDSLKSDIAAALAGLRDQQQGATAVRAVRPREEVYSGPCLGDAPDLLVYCAPAYRLSWGTSMGAVPRGVFEDNTKKWSGDHIIDPMLVPGVLFMNQPFAGEAARLEDMAPTILAALGLPRGPAMEGVSLAR